VAEAAIAAGAAIVNDVSGLIYPELARICAATGAALAISHMRRRPNQKIVAPVHHEDVVSDVYTFLAKRIDLAVSLGVPFESVILDPGPDLAKTPAQTVQVLRQLDQIRKLGRPLLLALSRKDFIGAITLRSPRNRDAGTMAAVALAAQCPGNIFRVHDVKSTVDVLKVVDMLSGRTAIPADFELPDDIRIEGCGPF
jgi:dihydropteroate synthase